jgi:hypothetical protein
MYGESPICDYVTLYLNDGRAEGVFTGKYVFTVPASAYMFQDRGQYCLVSMADGSFFQNTEDSSITVGIENVMNHGHTQNTATNEFQPAILGHFNQVIQHGNNDYKHEFIPNRIKYLTQSRPTQIRIKLAKANSTRTGVAFDDGYVTLKFEYLSKEQVALMNESVATNIAF